MRRFVCVLLLAAICLSLGGCFLDPAENLYAVPKQSASFYHLQTAIENAMSDNAAYSAPVSGENQQAVQMADVDGDSDDEAIVYLKTEGEKPLRLCVFDMQGGSYSLLAKIDGVGNAFDQVQYVQFDDKKGNEIVVGRRISDSVTQVLSVLTLQNGELVELINTSYHEFITSDLNLDGLHDVLLLNQDGDAANGIAVYYHWGNGQPIRELEASLSAPVSAVKRIITGRMCEGVPAVFVASTYDEEKIVTDIFGLRGGSFANLSLTGEPDTGVKTVREYYVYSCDIDSDGLIELPRLLPMPSIAEDESSNNQSLIRWYNLQLDGTERVKSLTYHNYSDGWYLTIPEAWKDNVAVTSFTAFGSNRGYRFVDAQSGRTIFSIISVLDKSAARTVEEEEWIQLVKKGEFSYSCALGEAARLYSIDEAAVRAMFHFIRIDWNTGET
ncbi:MAG: hypothetical protein E7434_06415 [Ruminococcaceae bacterium]|nr:hypothetical protein [Oscillospiraceae bacterium]